MGLPVLVVHQVASRVAVLPVAPARSPSSSRSTWSGTTLISRMIATNSPEASSTASSPVIIRLHDDASSGYRSAMILLAGLDDVTLSEPHYESSSSRVASTDDGDVLAAGRRSRRGAPETRARMALAGDDFFGECSVAPLSVTTGSRSPNPRS